MPARSPHVDRFALLLVVVTAAIVTASVVDVGSSLSGALLVHTFNGAALMAAVRAAGVSTGWRRAADVLVFVSVALSIILLLVDWFTPTEIDPVIGGNYLWLIAAFAVPVVVARRVAMHQQVTSQTVMGAVAAYLQIAVAYATAYQALDQTGGPIFESRVPSTTYQYFSLTTISTLGYGDVTATTALSQMIAVSEAVVGQVYLVVFVALIVSRFSRSTAPEDTP